MSVGEPMDESGRVRVPSADAPSSATTSELPRLRRAQLAALVVILIGAVALGVLTLGGAGLDGSSWTLVAWSASSADPTAFTITIEFSSGMVGGQAPVNSYGGAYSARRDGRIEIREISSTLMAGPESAMRAEALYFELLGRVDHWRVDGDTLTLSDGRTEALVFERTR